MEFSVLEPQYPGSTDDLAVTVDFAENIYVSLFYISGGRTLRKFMFIADWRAGTLLNVSPITLSTLTYLS